MLHVLWLVLRVVIALTAAVLIYTVAARTSAHFSKREPPPVPSEAELDDVD